MKIAAFTPFCSADAHYIPRYLAEVERLDVHFSVHIDRMRDGYEELVHHPRCVGFTKHSGDEEYTEQHKQGALEILQEQGFDWAVHWDADEVWERDAPAKLRRSCESELDHQQVTWVNAWGDINHIRVDTIFAYPPRVKLYNLQHDPRTGRRRRWFFDHPITYGCKMVDNTGRVMHGIGDYALSDLVCIHTGYMTRELRLYHKERWDRIITTAVGNQPLKTWEYVCNEEQFPATVVPNPYV